jgi:hypothetical protein
LGTSYIPDSPYRIFLFAASSSLTDPALLFYHKDGKKAGNWKMIGMGYTFAFDRDRESPPTKIPEIPTDAWLIHEEATITPDTVWNSPQNQGSTS